MIQVFTFQDKWIDEQTRALFFDFTVYSPVLKSLVTARLLLEVVSYGGIFPHHSFRVYQFFRYAGKVGVMQVNTPPDREQFCLRSE